MASKTSRRDFLSAGLSAGLTLPVLGAGSRMGFGQANTGAAGSAIKLDYRTLGRTGLKVTTVGFGCMITSDASVVTRAADLGINYFDTARSYQHGNNERMVGAALGAKRKQIVLSTKTHAPDKAGMLSELDESLKQLNTDYVDIWYLHARSKADDITDDMIEAQQVAKKLGKIRFAGVSTHSGQQQLLPWMAQKGVFDVALVAYNFSMDPGMTQAIATVAKAGIGGHEGDGGRIAQPARHSPRRQDDPAWRDAVGAEVGGQPAQHHHHRSQHDGHGPVGREPEGHGGAADYWRRKDPGRASGNDPAALLPPVRRV